MQQIPTDNIQTCVGVDETFAPAPTSRGASMKRSLIGVIVCFAALVGLHSSSASGADDKDTSNAKKIVGKWSVVKGEGVPPGAIMEFSAENKVIFHVDQKGKLVSFPVGTYKVDGDKVTLTVAKGGKKDDETNTIKKLTNDSLILADSQGKEIELKRMK
jgi:uncharacterized protein (TIGR03066 family)